MNLFSDIAWFLLRSCHGMFSYVLYISFLIASESHAQSTDSFLIKYALFTDTQTDKDTHTTAHLFQDLLSIHRQSHGRYDSLIIEAIILDYQQRTRELSTEERLEWLRANQTYLIPGSKLNPHAAAVYYGFYIPLFSYQLDSVSRYLDLIGQHLDAVKQPTDLRLWWWYEKARLATRQGDFDAGLHYGQRGLDYLRTNFPDHQRQEYQLLNGTGIAYRRMGRTDEAIALFEGMLLKHREGMHQVKLTGMVLNNLGLAHKDCGDWYDAVNRIRQAIQYYQMHVSPGFADIGTGYDNVAICFEALGRPDSALIYSYKSIAFIRHHLGENHPDLLLPMNSIVYIHLLHDQPEKARMMSDSSLNFLQSTGWTPESPEGNYYLSDGFDLFAYRIGIFREFYAQTGDTAYLNASIHAGEAFVSLTDYAYDHLQNDISKEIFQKEHGIVFSACIDDLYTAYVATQDSTLMERAFAYAEKFKSLELLYAAQKDKASEVRRFRLLNDEHQQYLDSIRFYEDQFGEYEAAARLNILKTSLDLWKERVKRDQPDYYQLIYHPDQVTIASIQASLDTNQCILSYHVAADAVFMFVITQGQRYFIKADLQEDLTQMISLFRKAINGYFTQPSPTEAGYLEYADALISMGYALYCALLEPVDVFLSKRVVIIVDKALGYIPFDLLLKTLPQQGHRFRDHHYVLQDHAISYSYSCRLWSDMRAMQSEPGFDVLAMAPVFGSHEFSTDERGNDRHLPALLYNEAEVNEIRSILPGRSCIKARATKERFLRMAGSFPIIHLATHSKANDERGDHSYLAFSPTADDNGILYASDVYDLELNAELITLSACETGLGELKSGEGIISLARAFTFAGARSIVSSLWSVNDKSTSALMTAFYTSLKEGLPKDIALQQSKLEFLQSHGHADAHPFYWGGFICVGDMEPMKGGNIPLSLLLIIGLTMAALLFFLFFKKIFSPLGTKRK